MMPEYIDGVFKLCKRATQTDPETKYKTEVLQDLHMSIYYRELAIFDRTKVELNSAGIDVQIKICIPEYRAIKSDCVLIINDEQYEVYNVAHITTKEGFKESEITLITPSVIREVMK